MKTRNNYKRKDGNIKNSREGFKRHGKSSGAKDMMERDPEGTNDVSWYGVSPQILRDASAHNFYSPTGSKLKLEHTKMSDTFASHHNQFRVPGIMSVTLVPTIGWSADRTCPVNVAAQNIYSFVRHANAGHANYDPADLMLYLISMTSVYSYLNFLQRCYGLASLYTMSNQYLPHSALVAAGVDPKSLTMNLANFRYRINLLINKAGRFVVPDSMPIFKRQAFLYQNIYVESPTIRDQLYQFVPGGFLAFREKNALLTHILWDYRSVYKYIHGQDVSKSNGELLTWDMLVDFGDKMLDQIIASEDLGIMNGDIMKAYGTNVLKLTLVPEYYPIVPVFNHDVLMQIHNCRIVNFDYTNSSLCVESTYTNSTDPDEPVFSLIESKPSITVAKPNTNDAAVVWQMQLMYSSNRSANVSPSLLIDVDVENPTPEQIMEYTRLSATYSEDDVISSEAYFSTVPLYSGSEVVVDVSIALDPTYDSKSPKEFAGGVYNDVFMHFSQYAVNVTLSGTKNVWPSYIQPLILSCANESLWSIMLASSFKYAPLAYVQHMSIDTAVSTADAYKTKCATYDNLTPVGNITNVSVFNAEDLKKLHHAAMLSLWASPAVGLVKQ